jgi:hypothetical protein
MSTLTFCFARIAAAAVYRMKPSRFITIAQLDQSDKTARFNQLIN